MCVIKVYLTNIITDKSVRSTHSESCRGAIIPDVFEYDYKKPLVVGTVLVYSEGQHNNHRHTSCCCV